MKQNGILPCSRSDRCLRLFGNTIILTFLCVVLYCPPIDPALVAEKLFPFLPEGFGSQLLSDCSAFNQLLSSLSEVSPESSLTVFTS